MQCLAPHFAAGVLGPVIAACSYIYHYFPTAANEPEVWHIYRKWLSSTFKNKVESNWSFKRLMQWYDDFIN